MMRRILLPTICFAASCAHPAAVATVPPAPTIDAPVHDYRGVTRADVHFAVDSTPLSVIPIETGDTVPLGLSTDARRVGQKVAVVHSAPFSRVRDLSFYDDSGRILGRVLDTTLFPEIATRIGRGNDGSLILHSPGRWKTFDRDGRAIAADSAIRLGMLGDCGSTPAAAGGCGFHRNH